VDVKETGCRLQELQPNTTYFVSVVAVDGQDESGQSASVRFTTEVNEIRFAETIVKKCKKIVNRNGMDVFAVPLTKLSGPAATADRFAFGRADALHKGKMQHRTILVMGATGSGKTTLINGMINFIFDVQ
jgi:type IV secretory pathway ATPase VirB11/archaellum biosynthesis ATPase